MIFKMIKSDSGQAMVMSIMVSGVIAAGAYFLMAPDPNRKSLKINNVKYSAEMVKENLMAVLDNDAAWAKTIELNSNLACLRTPGTCATSSFGAINVYDADGTLVAGLAPTSGFDLSGKPCNTFSSTGPDLNCVFKYTVTASCNGACEPTTLVPGMPVAVSPRIRIVGSFQFASKDKDLDQRLSGLNPTYRFDFMRGSKGKTLSQYCNSIEGVFDQRTSICRSAISKPKSFDCTTANPHSWFIGFRKDGTPVCKNDMKLGLNCPSGTAVLGYSADGRMICGAF